ncbi:MAG: hypothetical protein EZS28_009126 [Streblomastix strix]|uniref:Uncharacterized protein n=1 Tax=Streblomastix strix TaxID=222440 RepID=A0A5J4WL41_9EUKA|nr:MAG: hypothetical protein EZS28_009126 [Streblomastix strix]
MLLPPSETNLTQSIGMPVGLRLVSLGREFRGKFASGGGSSITRELCPTPRRGSLPRSIEMLELKELESSFLALSFPVLSQNHLTVSAVLACLDQ